MTDMFGYDILLLALAGILALCLSIRFPTQRWPRPMAVSAAGGLVAVLAGQSGALPAILLTGLVMTACAAGARSE